jgi:hypothetical protein
VRIGLKLTLGALLLSVAACGSAADRRHENSEAAEVDESQLLGVRFIGPPETLAKVERAANAAGWAEIRHDKPGSILAVSPKPYRFEYFTKLIDAVDRVSPRNFSLQLIGPDGNPVDLGPPEGSD